METTLLGIVMLVKGHDWNDAKPILVTPFGIVMLDKEVHDENAVRTRFFN
jgi:hypothetical protein